MESIDFYSLRNFEDYLQTWNLKSMTFRLDHDGNKYQSSSESENKSKKLQNV